MNDTGTEQCPVCWRPCKEVIHHAGQPIYIHVESPSGHLIDYCGENIDGYYAAVSEVVV